MLLNLKILKAINKGLNEALALFDLDDFNFNDEIKTLDIRLDKISASKRSMSKLGNTEVNDLLKKRLETIRLTKSNINKVNALILQGATYKVTDETIKPLIEKYIKLNGEDSDLNWIDTSDVTNMDSLFEETKFNGNISDWNVSNVTTMRRMFEATKSFDLDLSKWDVSNVTDMSYMFAYTTRRLFDLNISNWNVSNVSRMNDMFTYCDISYLDLSKWDVSNVRDFQHMFGYANIDGIDLSKWDVSRASNLCGMFSHCKNVNIDFSKWDVSECNDFSHMFENCEEFTGASVKNWDVKSGVFFLSMFANTPNLNTDLGNWNMDNAENINSMFYNSDILCDLSSWKLPKIRVDETSFVFRLSGMLKHIKLWPPKLLANSYSNKIYKV